MKSSQPRKQRLAIYNAPMHKRQKLVAAHLSDGLIKEYGRRSLPVRTGDSVEILRGDFAGTKGKIEEVDLKSLRIKVDSVKRRKTDGTEVKMPLHPSNIRITETNMSDKERAKMIERSGGKATVTKVKEEKKEEAKKTESGFKCQVCKEVFSSQNELNAHMGEKHKDYTIG